MDELEPRRSVDFEQVVVPNGRRRRFDPLIIGSILVAFGVLVGIAWPDEMPTAEPTTAPSAAAAPTTPAAVSPDPQVLGLDPPDIAMAESVARGLQNLGAWGIRTYEVVDGAIERRWTPVEPGEGAISPLVVVDSASIVLIEVTSPPDLAPLDVRVWARGYVGQWDWIHTGWPAFAPPAGRVLLRPPVVNQRWLPVWPAGRYRLDLLLGEHIARIDLTIDRDAPTLDAPISDWSVPIDRETPRWAVDPPVGPFAIVRGLGRPLHVAASGPLGIAAAWSAPGDLVARDWLPAATGLGVILPAGARDPQVALRRLVPEELFIARDPVTWSLGRADDGPDLAVRFDARPRDRIDPGIYAIDATWIGPDGPDSATWTIELQPAPGMASSTPPLLDAFRLAQDLDEGDALVRDASFGAGPPNRWIEPLTDTAGCTTEAAAPVVALVLTDRPDGSVDAVRLATAEPSPPFVRRVRLVRPMPGITVVYPGTSFAFVPGDYTVSVDGTVPRTLRFCITVGPSGPFG